MFDPRRLAARPSLLAILTVLATVPATAEDKEIDGDRTSTVTTSTEIGTASGTLTLTSDGSVEVSNGTAIVVDGPHRLVVEGNVSSRHATNGRGIWFNSNDKVLRSSLSLSGDISVGVTSDDFDADDSTNLVGVALTGLGVRGNINIASSTSITVWGGDGRGILVDAPLDGNLVNRGGINMQGNRSVGIDVVDDIDGKLENWGSIAARTADSYGIRIDGDVTGNFTHGGSVQAGQTQGTDKDGKPIPAVPGKAGIYVSGSVGGGIVFQGVGDGNELDLDGDDEDDITSDSAIITSGGTAALVIENTRGDSIDQVIGLVDGEDKDLSFIHRGNITVSGSSKRINATGMIFGSDAAGIGRTVFEGGFDFDRGSLTVGALNANAVGIHFKGGVDLPSFDNDGIINVTATRTGVTGEDGETTYGPGGNATGILIDTGNTFPAFKNSGRVVADATGEDKTSIAIFDRSGTLASITNSGSIIATAPNGTAIALDLRANTNGAMVNNSGNIIGKVFFGNGNDTLIVDEGIVKGDLSFGFGNDKLQLLNGGEISGAINFKGTLALTVEDGDLSIGSEAVLNATTADFNGTGAINIAVDAEENKAGRINITGAVNIGDKITISPVLESFVRTDRTFDLITAGSINLSDAGSSLELAETPFLFDLDLTADSDSVSLHLRPKSSAELGLTNQLATIHTQFLEDNSFDRSLESYVANLKTVDEVKTTFRKLMPDVSNDSFNMLLLSERRLARLVSERTESVGRTRNDDGSLWGSQHFERLTAGDTGAMLPGTITSIGVTLGLDQSISDAWLVGLAAGFSLDQSDRNDEVGSEMSLFTPFLSGYALGRFGDAHIALNTTARYTDINRTRDLVLDIEERNITSSTSGIGITGSAEVGYDLALGDIHLKPTALVRATQYKESGYTEEDGIGAGFEIGKRSLTRVESELGARLQYHFRWLTRQGSEMRLVPELRATYAKAMSGDEVTDITARFEHADEAFVIQSDKLYDNLKSFGGGIALFGNGATGRLSYDYRDYGTLTGHSAVLSVSLSF